MAFIECRDLHFSYSEESGEVLHGVDLDIEKGSFVRSEERRVGKRVSSPV